MLDSTDIQRQTQPAASVEDGGLAVRHRTCCRICRSASRASDRLLRFDATILPIREMQTSGDVRLLDERCGLFGLAVVLQRRARDAAEIEPLEEDLLGI